MNYEYDPSLLHVAILCGGESQRFGTDKGLFCPRAKNESIVGKAIRRFLPVTKHVWIIVKDDKQRQTYQDALARELLWDENKISVITDCDALPEYLCQRSALTGIATALSVVPSNSMVAIIPVDQVGIRPLHLSKLLRDAGDVTSSTRPVCFQLSSNRIEPFPSIWPQGSKAHILSRIASGENSVIQALLSADAITVPCGSHEIDIRTNVNDRISSEKYFGRSLQDPFGRELRYLRLSLTEACNMSCQYCLPKGFEHWLRHRKILDNNQLRNTIEGFRLLGFDKIRFTGGEPTVHPRCLDAVKIARQSGYDKICITTNGALIKSLEPWVEAGLHQINFSLDSLNAEVFAQVTGSDTHGHVMKMIQEALDRGLEVKINSVLMQSVNAKEAENLINFALERQITLRFIELMPTGSNHKFAANEVVRGTQLIPLLQSRGLAQSSNNSPLTSGPEQLWASPNHKGRIGLINPLSNNFCGACNRLRISAQGKLRLCLFGQGDVALDMTSPESVAKSVREAIVHKPEKHNLEKSNWGNVETFRTIGG